MKKAINILTNLAVILFILHFSVKSFNIILPISNDIILWIAVICALIGIIYQFINFKEYKEENKLNVILIGIIILGIIITRLLT